MLLSPTLTEQALSTDLAGQLNAALQHPNPNVRAGAAIALGRLGSGEAAGRLMAALHDPAHRVQQSAIRALGMLGAPAVEHLLDQLRRRTDPELAQRMADALGQVRDPGAVDLLSAALNYLEPPARFGAADALGAIGDRRAVPALVQLARAPDGASRRNAAQALLGIGAEEAVHALSSLLNEQDPRLRTFAVERMADLPGEQVVLPLLSTLTDPDETVRQAAAASLQQLQGDISADILLTTLNTQNPFIQQAAAAALAHHPGPRVTERLFALMNEQGDLQTRLAAAQSLSLLGDARGASMILRTLNAPNVEIRRQAALALAGTGSLEAVDPLIDSIRQKGLDLTSPRDRQLRRRIVASLACIGPDVVPPMIALLADRSSTLRALGFDVLLQIGPEAVEPLSIAMAVHPNQELRTAAARLLGMIGDERAIQPLQESLRETLLGPYPIVFYTRLFIDPNAPVRAAAAAALGAIGSQDGASLLLSSARYDPDSRVNAEAEAALAQIGSPAVIVRFAALDPVGIINRALVGAVGLLAVGFLAGLASAGWGLADAALLAGLAGGSALGLADGLDGRRQPLRGAFLGAAAALLLGWGLSRFGIPAWSVSAAAALLPVLGALAGWGRPPLLQRLAGLFGGMILGFLGAGIAALILGTID